MSRWGVLFVLLMITSLPRLAAAQTPEQMCSVYAARAVQQYQAMTSHPACHVPDDLRWQNSYENHFRGCMVAPQIAPLETQARDNQLRACGALAALAPAPASVLGAWTDNTGGSGVWQIQLGTTSNDLVAFLPNRTTVLNGNFLGANQIFINFAFLGPGCCTANLSADGQSLLWSNGAIWRR